MKEITNVIDAINSKNVHIVKVADIQRHIFSKSDAEFMLTVSGSQIEPGEYVLAKIDVLIPTQARP